MKTSLPPKPLPTQELLKRLFTYNPKDGRLRHAQSFGKAVKGYAVGTLCDNGFLRAQVAGEVYYVHRLIWMWWHGYDPGELRVVQKNGDREDNRIDNLGLE